MSMKIPASLRTKNLPHARLLPVRAGHITVCKLMIPFSMRDGQIFTVGAVRFQVMRASVKALDPIPQSYFVDLSAPCADSEE